MNIALDATPLTISTGGVARYTRELARALALEFPEDHFWLLSDQIFQLPGMLLRNLHQGAPPQTLLGRKWWLWGLDQEMSRHGVDVFHGTDFSVPYLRRRPTVLTLHDLSPWLSETWQPAAARVRRRTPVLLRSGRATFVITPSEAVRKAAIERFSLNPDRVVAIPLAASEHFHPVETAALPRRDHAPPPRPNDALPGRPDGAPPSRLDGTPPPRSDTGLPARSDDAPAQPDDALLARSDGAPPSQLDGAPPLRPDVAPSPRPDTAPPPRPDRAPPPRSDDAPAQPDDALLARSDDALPARSDGAPPSQLDGSPPPRLADALPSRPDRAPPPRPYFLFVGTLEPRKNIGRLIEAWREVHQSHDVDLVLAGRTRADFTTPTPEPGLRILGAVPEEDLAGLYSGALACVYPSLYEGFGLPVLEAMQCGALVITSQDPAIREVSGGAAIHVDAHETRELAQALAAVARAPETFSAQRERGLARSRQFTWQRTARLTREVYEEASRVFHAG